MIKELQETTTSALLKLIDMVLSREGIVGMLLVAFVGASIYDDVRSTSANVEFAKTVESLIVKSKEDNTRRLELLERMITSFEDRR